MTIKQKDLKFFFKQRHRVFVYIGTNISDQPAASIQSRRHSITLRKYPRVSSGPSEQAEERWKLEDLPTYVHSVWQKVPRWEKMSRTSKQNVKRRITTTHFALLKGKVIPLHARCGPEGG